MGATRVPQCCVESGSHLVERGGSVVCGVCAVCAVCVCVSVCERERESALSLEGTLHSYAWPCLSCGQHSRLGRVGEKGGREMREMRFVDKAQTSQGNCCTLALGSAAVAYR